MNCQGFVPLQCTRQAWPPSLYKNSSLHPFSCGKFERDHHHDGAWERTRGSLVTGPQFQSRRGCWAQLFLILWFSLFHRSWKQINERYVWHSEGRGVLWWVHLIQGSSEDVGSRGQEVRQWVEFLHFFRQDLTIPFVNYKMTTPVQLKNRETCWYRKLGELPSTEWNVF